MLLLRVGFADCLSFTSHSPHFTLHAVKYHRTPLVWPLFVLNSCMTYKYNRCDHVNLWPNDLCNVILQWRADEVKRQDKTDLSGNVGAKQVT